MQIVDRYLESVKDCLPKAQADDIIKELSENISSQIEDKEGELARPLTDGEIEAILKQHGHPLLVASRYRQEQRNVSFGRQIIGPMLFPFYIRVLKFNLGLTGVILIVIFAALFASGQPAGGLPQVFLYQLLIQFGIHESHTACALSHCAHLRTDHAFRGQSRYRNSSPWLSRSSGFAPCSIINS